MVTRVSNAGAKEQRERDVAVTKGKHRPSYLRWSVRKKTSKMKYKAPLKKSAAIYETATVDKDVLTRQIINSNIRAVIRKRVSEINQQASPPSQSVKIDLQKVTDIVVIYSKILEVKEKFVYLECYFKDKESVIQRRKFEIAPFMHIVPLKIGQPVRIEITTKPGQRIFTYSPAEGSDLPQFKEPENHFKDISDTPHLKPIQFGK